MHHRLQGIANLPTVCQKLGIRNVVLCPGSRNAPLTISLTQSTMNCYSIIDERSAAYFALGIAIAKKEPVIAVCTSGTAALNFSPAVAEAFYQQVPLIIITADRPSEWINQNDGQTLGQQNIYQNYCLASYCVPAEQRKDDDLWHFTNKLSRAIATATGIKKGPVHINMPISEPLYDQLPEPNTIYMAECIETTPSLTEFAAQTIIHDWQQYSRRLIICGFNAPNHDLNEIIEPIIENHAIVIAENIANIQHKDIIYNPDPLLHLLSHKNNQETEPDLVITIGHSIISKRLKSYLRENKKIIHWHISETGEIIDTFKKLKKVIPIRATNFFKLIASHPAQTDSKYIRAWKNAHKELENKRELFFNAHTAFTDLTVFELIHKKLTNEFNIHISNSTPIRSSQLLKTVNGAHYYCNRGTSGIDGSTSTAIGFANASPKATILFTGDLSFFYDSNGLWHNYLPNSFKIVLFNNACGNIFKLLPTQEIPEKTKKFIYTTHSAKAQGIAIGYNFTYFCANNFAELNNSIAEFLTCAHPSILEIKTDPENNTKTFKEFYKNITS